MLHLEKVSTSSIADSSEVKFAQFRKKNSLKLNEREAKSGK